MRRIPSPVAIIGAAVNGERSGMAATAWASLSADPPMLLVCVNGLASSHRLITAAGGFSLSVVPESERETVAIFSAQRGLAGADRFLDGHWEDGPLGYPMLRRAVVSFECSLEDTHTHGTHTIFIGRVGEMRESVGEHPLLYLGGSYAAAAPMMWDDSI